MFRDLKEYQEIAKIYADKVSKPEELEERRGSSSAQLAQNRKDAFKPATPPQKGAGGGSGNPTNTRGTGTGAVKFDKPTGAAQGRTRRPDAKPEIKKFPTTAEIRAANPNAVGGGNAGGSTDSGGTSQSTIKSVEQKSEVKTPDPKPKKMHPIEKKNRERFGDAHVDKLKSKNKDFKLMRSKKMSKDDFIKKYPKSMTAQKAKMEEYTPYDFVLEYLLSSEQAATIEEANYVMTEMDAETIQAIVEEQKKNLDEGLASMALKTGAAVLGGVLAKKGLDKGKKSFDNYLNKQRDKGIGGNTRPGSDKIYYGDKK